MKIELNIEMTQSEYDTLLAGKNFQSASFPIQCAIAPVEIKGMEKDKLQMLFVPDHSCGLAINGIKFDLKG